MPFKYNRLLSVWGGNPNCQKELVLLLLRICNVWIEGKGTIVLGRIMGGKPNLSQPIKKGSGGGISEGVSSKS
jgi:hypothetical protein